VNVCRNGPLIVLLCLGWLSGAFPAGAAEPPTSPTPAKVTDSRDQRISQLETLVKQLQEQVKAGQADRALIQQLVKTIQALQARIKALETKAAAPNPTPTPTPTPVPQPTPAPSPTSAGHALLIPDISVVGTSRFNGGTNDRRLDNRGFFFPDEIELAFQSRVAPNLRADIFVNAEEGDDFSAGVEEGYFTYTTLGPGLSFIGGRKRLEVDRVNPLHNHQLPYVTYPAPLRNFLSPDGLIADGGEFSYLLPTGPNLFANLFVGRWKTASEPDGPRGFAGGSKDGAWSARLQLGKEVGQDKELGVGFSHYFGRGSLASMGGGANFAVSSVDLTYEQFLDAYRSFKLQTEFFLHRTRADSEGGEHPRIGFFIHGIYHFRRFWAVGVLYEQSQFPYPTVGTESALNLILTHWFTEQTNATVQVQAGGLHDNPFGAIFFKLNFGFGPHVHALQ